MLRLGATPGAQRVDLVDEDGAGGVEAGLKAKGRKVTDGDETSKEGVLLGLTISKSSLTSFSDSPLYLEVSVEEDTLKKVVPHSVATALASMVLPVPGGPTMRTPLHGLRMPLKKSGIHMGSTTASSSSRLASCRSAMSSQCVLGSFCTMSRSSISMRSRSMPPESNFLSSPSPSSSSSLSLSPPPPPPAPPLSSLLAAPAPPRLPAAPPSALPLAPLAPGPPAAPFFPAPAPPAVAPFPLAPLCGVPASFLGPLTGLTTGGGAPREASVGPGHGLGSLLGGGPHTSGSGKRNRSQ